jgi:hypothetical protein
VVLPHTYVGEDIELDNAVASGRHLVNATLETTIEVTDHSILSALPRHGWPSENPQSSDKRIALGLKIALAPAYHLLRIWVKKPAECGLVMATLPGHRTEGLRETAIAAIPAAPLTDTPGSLLSHFLNTFYPGLGEVMRGRLKLQGPEIRSRTQVMQLHDNWRELYWGSKCGLLQETLVIGSEGMAQDARYAADALAANCRSQRATLKLVRRYLVRVYMDCIEMVFGHRRVRITQIEAHRDSPLNRIH